MERIARTRIVTVLVLAVVFGAGVLLGLAVNRSLEAGPPEETAAAEEAPRERRVPLYERVGPDEEQSILIEAIMKDFREAMRALHAEFREAYNPRYDALVRDTREAIKGVFTPEQAMAYDSLIAESERRRAERGSRERRDEG